MKVAYLGPKGTFSYEACNIYCNNEKQMIEYKTIPETILALQNLEVDEAIVPIENSIQGCVTDAIDTLISNQDIKVKGELTVQNAEIELKRFFVESDYCDYVSPLNPFKYAPDEM